MRRRTFIPANRWIELSLPCQLSQVDTLRLVSVTGGHRADRGRTYKLFESVTFVALLEREAREATARGPLCVGSDLGSVPAMLEFGEGFKFEWPKQPRANRRDSCREGPGQEGYLGCVFWSYPWKHDRRGVGVGEGEGGSGRPVLVR